MQKDIAAKTSRVKKLQQEWRTIRKELLVKQKELTAAMDAGSKEREELVVSMDSSHLERLPVLRAQQNQPVSQDRAG